MIGILTENDLNPPEIVAAGRDHQTPVCEIYVTRSGAGGPADAFLFEAVLLMNATQVFTILPRAGSAAPGGHDQPVRRDQPGTQNSLFVCAQHPGARQS